MLNKIRSLKIPSLALFSFLAGCVNGFLGTGGGIILIYMLSFFTKNNKKDNFAAALCVTVPMSLVALYSYARGGAVDFALGGILWLPCALGGLLGAFLVDKLRLPWLNAIFAVLVIYSGTCMIFR